MTDDLGAMKASRPVRLPDAVLTALRAGADMALWTSTAELSTVLDRTAGGGGGRHAAGVERGPGHRPDPGRKGRLRRLSTRPHRLSTRRPPEARCRGG